MRHIIAGSPVLKEPSAKNAAARLAVLRPPAETRFLDGAARASFPEKFPGAWLRECGAPGLGPLLAEIINRPARLYLERPGKMLRPLITNIVLRAFGKRPGSYAEVLGAIELMEAATVSFDDIIDGSDTRRGGRATHKLYGVKNAYLAYQAAYNWAYRAFLSPELKIKARVREEILASLAREIFAYGYAQASELYWTAEKKAPAPEQYLNMTWDRIRFLSFNGPFRIGALLGGAGRERVKHFEAAGSWLGMAYHLHGDELNLFPRSPEWGKPLADDITGGRYTFLYLSALRTAGVSGRRALSRALGNKRISVPGLKNVIDIVRESGAIKKNRDMIGIFYGKARAALEKCRLPAGRSSLLFDLARYMAYDRTK